MARWLERSLRFCAFAVQGKKEFFPNYPYIYRRDIQKFLHTLDLHGIHYADGLILELKADDILSEGDRTHGILFDEKKATALLEKNGGIQKWRA